MSSVVFMTATEADGFIVYGRLLHAYSPAKAKARLPNSNRGFCAIRLTTDEERRRCLTATTVTEMHTSARYVGARLYRALYAVRHSLNSMRYGTESSGDLI